MSSLLPIIARLGNLPLNFQPSALQYASAFRRRLSVEVDGTKVLLGSTEATKPTRDIGPWLNNGGWHAWDTGSADYVPISQQFSTNSNSYLSDSVFTSNHYITLPDASGVAALLLDTYVPRETIILTGSTVTIDWSKSSAFILNLSGSTTVSFTGSAEGEEIAMAVVNAGTGYTVTWPDTVRWPLHETPTQATASAGIEASTLYIFRTSAVTGQLLYYGIGDTGYTTGAVAAPATGGTGSVMPGYGRTGLGYGTFGSPQNPRIYNEP